MTLRAISLLVCLVCWSACSGGKSEPKPLTVPVSVGEVIQKTVPVQLKAIGNVEAYSTVGIKSRLAGQLLQVDFKEGQDVKKGDLLFVIDPRPYEAALKQAEANLARDTALFQKAERDAVRYADLVQRDFVSRQEYDQMRANADSLKATVQANRVAVENARLNLGYCYIHAPFTGRTGNVLAHQGNMIKDNADNPMLIINQIQPIYVSFSVPENNLPVIKKFMAQGKVKVDAIIPTNPEHPEEGVLTFINNTVDQTTGTIQLKATYDNTDKRLWPGLFVNVVVKLTQEPNAILAPAPAIQSGQEGEFVWVVKPDLTVETRVVEVERSLDGDVVIKKGLQAGERVVTEGQLRLVAGAKVQIKSGL
ncbi:MAG: hypothetical protein A2Y80_09480 [Deltaproteobacteria bacterium RBG_13_58_19]|nr:MAG: hypothetical protein A2Y80_09480 [Deltaproteobacteria bacterium RBG_13_58_19]